MLILFSSADKRLKHIGKLGGATALGLLDIFRRKKKEEEKKTDVETPQKIDELEQICGDDKETYEALVDTMFLDPRKIEGSLKEAAEKAKKFEKANDCTNAITWYKIAGGLAIYKGDVKKVVEYFTSIERLSQDKFTILKNPEKAVEKAQEYYKRFLAASS